MSVRKREWITSNGTAREAWVVDYVGANGARHLKTFERKKEADAYHSSVNVEVASGLHTPANKSKTVAEAGRLWIETGEANGLERSTVDTYRQHVDLHIVPYLGRLKLSELNAPVVRDFEDRLRLGKPAAGEQHGEARSPIMVRRVVISLGSLLADAQERGLVAQNVVRSLRVTRKGKTWRSDRRQRRKLTVGVDIPTPVEIRSLINSMEGRWRPLLLTAIFTGLRVSELRGLRWQDIDLRKGELTVRQRADKYKAIGKPKSEAGERTVPLPPIVVNTLKRWKLKCPKGALGLAFPTGKGNVERNENIVRRGLQPAVIAAGLTVPVLDAEGKPTLDKKGKPIVAAKYSGMHALRHFYASWCINRKLDGGLELPMKVVQERMGHSTIVLTADRYGHLFPRGDDSAEMAEAQRALLAVSSGRSTRHKRDMKAKTPFKSMV